MAAAAMKRPLARPAYLIRSRNTRAVKAASSANNDTYFQDRYTQLPSIHSPMLKANDESAVLGRKLDVLTQHNINRRPAALALNVEE